MRDLLIEIANKTIKTKDPSHDFFHALRVLKNCDNIGTKEGGDADVLIAGALFHDVICYPKNHEKSKLSSNESAKKAVEILHTVPNFPKDKIESVCLVISECSFSKGLQPSSLESMILQDADKLESTGFISIMRTFASAGQMGNQFYNEFDPFCEIREPDSTEYALDLFYTRLLKVIDLMNTNTAKIIAANRTDNLYYFLSGLKKELFEEF